MLEKEDMNTTYLRSADETRATLLQTVAKCGALEGLKRLLQRSADITHLNKEEKTVLHFAVEAGHIHVLKELLKHPGINLILNAKDFQQQTPLHVAAKLDYSKICRDLLHKGADPNARTTIIVDGLELNDATAFDLAIWNGNFQSTQKLRKHYRINGRTGCRWSPLHYAAAAGHLQILQYLLKDDKIHLKQTTSDETKRTAFDIALDFGHEVIANELLLQKDWRQLVYTMKVVPEDGVSYSPRVGGSYVVRTGGQRKIAQITKIEAITNRELLRRQPANQPNPLKAGPMETEYPETDPKKSAAYQVTYPQETQPNEGWLRKENFERVISNRIHGQEAKIDETYIISRKAGERKIAKVTLIAPENKCQVDIDGNGRETIDTAQIVAITLPLSWKTKEKLYTPMRHLVDKFPHLATTVMDKCIEDKIETKSVTYDFSLIDDTYVINEEENGEKSLKSGYEKDGSVLQKATSYFEKEPTSLLDEHLLMQIANSPGEDTKKLLEHELVSTFLTYRWGFLNRHVYMMFALIPFLLFLACYVLMLLFMFTDKITPTGVTPTGVTPTSVIPTGVAASASESTTGQRIGVYEIYMEEGMMKVKILEKWEKESNATLIRNQSGQLQSTSVWSWIFTFGALIFFVCLAVKEGFQLKKLGSQRYFACMENRYELIAYFFAAVVIGWRIFELFCRVKCLMFWFFAVISLIGLSFNLLVLLSASSDFGLTILMLYKVAKSSWSLIALPPTFFILFAILFTFLLENEKEFANPLHAFAKVMVMFTGEVDYANLFYSEDLIKDASKVIRFTTFLVFLLFVVVVPILLMNLFTGVAVDDIEKIRKEAKTTESRIKIKSMLMQGLLCEPLMRTAKYKIKVNYSGTGKHNVANTKETFLLCWQHFWRGEKHFLNRCVSSRNNAPQDARTVEAAAQAERDPITVKLYGEKESEKEWQKLLKERNTRDSADSNIETQIAINELNTRMEKMLSMMENFKPEPRTANV